MARIYTKTKKNAGKPKLCGVCKKEIQPKEKYYSWTNRMTVGKTYRGITKIRCAQHKPRPSDAMTGRSADFARLEESLSDAISNFNSSGEPDLSGFYSAIDDVISESENLREEIQSGRDSMPDHLQETGTGEQMGEWVEKLEAFESALDDAKNEFDESYCDESEVESEIAEPDETDLEDEDAERDEQSKKAILSEIRQSRINEKLDERREEIASRFEDISLEI